MLQLKGVSFSLTNCEISNFHVYPPNMISPIFTPSSSINFCDTAIKIQIDLFTLWQKSSMRMVTTQLKKYSSMLLLFVILFISANFYQRMTHQVKHLEEKNTWLHNSYLIPNPSSSFSIKRLWVIGFIASRTIKMQLHVLEVLITWDQHEMKDQ